MVLIAQGTVQCDTVGLVEQFLQTVEAVDAQ